MSDSKAFAWFEKAANQGCAEAQFNLAILYEEGRGVEQSDSMALRLFGMASTTGVRSADELARRRIAAIIARRRSSTSSPSSPDAEDEDTSTTPPACS